MELPNRFILVNKLTLPRTLKIANKNLLAFGRALDHLSNLQFKLLDNQGRNHNLISDPKFFFNYFNDHFASIGSKIEPKIINAHGHFLRIILIRKM